MINDGKKWHYLAVKKLSALPRGITSKHDGDLYCINCLHSFRTEVPFVVYADLESLLEKMNTCHNNPKNSSTTKINKHTPSGYSLFSDCSFDTTKNRLDYHRGKNCMKNVCLDLKVHAAKIINYDKK